MDCKQFEKCVDEFAAGSLSHAETKQARVHFATCSNCRDLFQATTEIKQVMLDLSIPELSEEFDSKLMAKLSTIGNTRSSNKDSIVTQIYSPSNSAKVAEPVTEPHNNYPFSKLVAGLAILIVTLSGTYHLFKAPSELVVNLEAEPEISREMMLNNIVMEIESENNNSGFYDIDTNALLESTSLAVNTSENCITKLIENNCELLLYTTDG